MLETQSWEDFYFSSRDDLKLFARKYGWHNYNAPVVVCLPGLTRNAADFHGLAMYLCQGEEHPYRVVCMDYRGRGNSEYDSEWSNYNPIVEAEDVVAGLTALGVEDVSIIGTSRGGLIAMLLTASKPSMINAVILNDAGPEIEAKGLVRIKSYMERVKPPSNLEEAIINLKDYSSAHFPNMPEAYWQKQVDLIYEVRNGKFESKFDRKLLNTLSAINLDAPLVSLWPQFVGLTNIPVLLLRGVNSDILSVETANRMRELHPGLIYEEIPGQGHAPDLETAGIPEMVVKFLSRFGEH